MCGMLTETADITEMQIREGAKRGHCAHQMATATALAANRNATDFIAYSKKQW